MSITIHWGANGSYKTAGVVNDFYIPAALSGRCVVTNIRGISTERTMMNLSDCHDNHEVIYIDTETLEGREKIAKWFHWVPHGALLLFDEAGVMFPKAWRHSDLENLNYPGGIEAASESDRPANWVQAWEMHRHYNWDIVLTVPNIKSMRSDIRETTEGAYKHKNKALLGPLFKGYKEGYHDAQKNGSSFTDFDVVRDKRVKGVAFDLYDSTKTGVFQNTLNGFNLFSSPRVLLGLGIAVLAFAYSLTQGGSSYLTEHSLGSVNESESQTPIVHQTSEKDIQSSQKLDQVAAYENLSQTFYNAPGHVDSVTGNATRNLTEPLSGYQIRIAASVRSSKGYFYTFSVYVDEYARTVSMEEIEQYGYKLNPINNCRVQLVFNDSIREIYCFDNSIAAI